MKCGHFRERSVKKKSSFRNKFSKWAIRPLYCLEIRGNTLSHISDPLIKNARKPQMSGSRLRCWPRQNKVKTICIHHKKVPQKNILASLLGKSPPVFSFVDQTHTHFFVGTVSLERRGSRIKKKIRTMPASEKILDKRRSLLRTLTSLYTLNIYSKEKIRNKINITLAQPVFIPFNISSSLYFLPRALEGGEKWRERI